MTISLARSAVHGLAKLAIGGRLPFRARQSLDFTDYLTTALTRGLRDAGATISQQLLR